jgi:superfamily I DNA/RNA helicase
MAGEVDYLLGRFLPETVDEYLTAERTGRGASPRVDRQLRQNLLDSVVRPYLHWLDEIGSWDWNEVAVAMANENRAGTYDIVIADETQDFSANQLRGIRNHLAPGHSVTFVLDTTQRIYARGFTWQEAGFTVRPDNVRRLNVNYRNTVEIARFAAPIVRGLPADPDGAIPDFSKCERHGPPPTVVRGRFSGQCDHAIRFIHNEVDLASESVAFLHPKGGGWFGEVERRLTAASLSYVSLTRQSEWPEGSENIALSTLHSAKGLEFDHVIIIGLNAEVTPHGEGDDDDTLLALRRLLAMGIGRARKTVTIGYKPEDASRLVEFLEPGTFLALNV